MLIAFFASVFTRKVFQAFVLTERVPREEQPVVDEDPVWDDLRELNLHKSMGSDGQHPKVWRELAQCP